MSVLGAVGDAARASTVTLKWLNEVGQIFQLRGQDLNDERPQIKVSVDLGTFFDTVADGLRFVTEFFEVISEPALHIYHSALLLVPVSSMIRKLYSPQISSAARAVTGIPTSWASESRENTFLCLFQRFSVRKGGKKRKVRTYRSHVVNK